ncbi:hypothetical protein NPX13_g10741 [Xylaria arbuscula]|uniref:Uncharacterized protein n=1 Tax=Xylaria arbuscula TaxID=114810 RepID=A0A9W8N485_9PEZI|nr:hypothetical protein NPX13_g10741 [Xylaria arbuscula]
MTALRLDEKVTGYSFCWNRHVVALKAHFPGEFITNVDRIHLIGAYPKSCWHPCSYELLHKADLNNSPFFVDEFSAGVHAVASGPVIGSIAEPYLPVASTPYPKSMSYEDYLYTTARVNNVAHVKLCRAACSSIITGLVFKYTDGH